MTQQLDDTMNCDISTEDVDAICTITGECLRVKEVKVVLGRSIKMAQYQYFKPGIELTAVVPKAHTVEDVCAMLYAKASEQLDAIISKEVRWADTERQYLKILHVYETAPKDSTAYALAKEKLVDMGRL